DAGIDGLDAIDVDHGFDDAGRGVDAAQAEGGAVVALVDAQVDDVPDHGVEDGSALVAELVGGDDGSVRTAGAGQGVEVGESGSIRMGRAGSAAGDRQGGQGGQGQV